MGAVVSVLVALAGAGAGAGAASAGAVGNPSLPAALLGPATVPGTVSEVALPVHMTGSIAVSFHGVQPGCAVRGLCRYSGSILWAPPAASGLDLYTVGSGPRRSYQAVLDLSGGAGTVSSRVDSGAAAGGLCTDAQQLSTEVALPVVGGRVRFGDFVALQDLLGTRCAGPRDAVLVPALPAPSLAVARVARGRITLREMVTRSFSGGGFAGTEAVRLTIGLSRPERARFIRVRHQRALALGFRVRLTGTLVTAVRGASLQADCAPLAVCGLTGTTTTTFSPAPVPASLGAIASASRPLRDLRAALGLSRHGNPNGISVSGFLFSPPGTLSARELTASGACEDTAHFGPGAIEMYPAAGGVLGVTIQDGDVAGSALTECPGPAPGMGTEVIASAGIPISRLTARRVTLTLAPGSPFLDEGFVATPIRSTLRLTLVRTALVVRPVFETAQPEF